MSWLDDHRQAALDAFRGGFTDQQWEAFRTGYCWQCLAQDPPRLTGRTHARILCGNHVRAARLADPTGADALTVVPFTVSAIDLTDVP